MGPVLGPPCPHHPCPGHMGKGSKPPAPRDGRPGEGQRLTPDAPHIVGRPPPRDGLRPFPAARSPPQGMRAKGTVPGPNARTPAPTARGGRTPTAQPEGGQPGDNERRTSDAPHNGARHPPPGTPPPPPPQRAMLSNKSARSGAHTSRARDTRATGPKGNPNKAQGCMSPRLTKG